MDVDAHALGDPIIKAGSSVEPEDVLGIGRVFGAYVHFEVGVADFLPVDDLKVFDFDIEKVCAARRYVGVKS